jgi:hypothetical protein
MISAALIAFANSCHTHDQLHAALLMAMGVLHHFAANFRNGASASSIMISRRCLVSSSETACRIYCGSPSFGFQKKKRTVTK